MTARDAFKAAGCSPAKQMRAAGAESRPPSRLCCCSSNARSAKPRPEVSEHVAAVAAGEERLRPGRTSDGGEKKPKKTFLLFLCAESRRDVQHQLQEDKAAGAGDGGVGGVCGRQHSDPGEMDASSPPRVCVLNKDIINNLLLPQQLECCFFFFLLFFFLHAFGRQETQCSAICAVRLQRLLLAGPGQDSVEVVYHPKWRTQIYGHYKLSRCCVNRRRREAPRLWVKFTCCN